MVRGICAYCGVDAELTKEHAAARWLPGKFPDHTSATPVMGRHLFGGALTIDDVCAKCNNERLSKLDNYAAEWWDRNVSSSVSELDADEALLGRWLAKTCYNIQRIEERQGTLGVEPKFSEPAARWIIGAVPLSGSVGICAASIPPSDRGSELNAGFGGPAKGLALPVRHVHFLGLLFFVCWRTPVFDMPAAGMVKAVCDMFEAVSLDLERGKGPRRLPALNDPASVEEGLYQDILLRMKLTERWKREDAGACTP